MKIQSIEDEREIAATAAKVLHERFIEAARTETVLYVKNDAVWSKAPNGDPILIKQLFRSNPDLAKNLLVEELIKLKNETLAL